MLETGRPTSSDSGGAGGLDPIDGDAVDFWSAGENAKGEFRCAGCGYGIAIHRALPVCPMCGGEAWEQASWRPLTRAAARTVR